MDTFLFYLKEGMFHITDINGYDHMLFLLSLLLFSKDIYIKNIILLITAFTIGHSLSLLLSVINVINIKINIIEFLIPLTILITSVSSIVNQKMFHVEHKNKYLYLIVLFFGVIHGLGFSNYLKFILTESESLLIALFHFNIGLELGQIFIISLMIIILKSLKKLLKYDINFNVFLHLFIIITSLKLCIERI